MYFLELVGHASGIVFTWNENATIWSVSKYVSTKYNKRCGAISALQKLALTHAGCLHSGWVYFVDDGGIRERVGQFIDMSLPHDTLKKNELEIYTPHKPLDDLNISTTVSAHTGKKDKILECFGIRKSITEWSVELGLTVPVLNYRIDYLKWDVEEALTRPNSQPHRKRA